jgi:hypothetical protein
MEFRELVLRLSGGRIAQVEDFIQAELLLRQLTKGDPRGKLVFALALSAALRNGAMPEQTSQAMVDVAETNEDLLAEPQAELFEDLLRKSGRSDDALRVRRIRERLTKVPSTDLPDTPVNLLAHLMTSHDWLFGPETERAQLLDDVVVQVASEVAMAGRTLSTSHAETIFFASTSYARLLTNPTKFKLISAIRHHIQREQELLVLAMQALATSASDSHLGSSNSSDAIDRGDVT